MRATLKLLVLLVPAYVRLTQARPKPTSDPLKKFDALKHQSHPDPNEIFETTLEAYGCCSHTCNPYNNPILTPIQLTNNLEKRGVEIPRLDCEDGEDASGKKKLRKRELSDDPKTCTIPDIKPQDEFFWEAIKRGWGACQATRCQCAEIIDGTVVVRLLPNVPIGQTQNYIPGRDPETFIHLEEKDPTIDAGFKMGTSEIFPGSVVINVPVVEEYYTVTPAFAYGPLGDPDLMTEEEIAEQLRAAQQQVTIISSKLYNDLAIPYKRVAYHPNWTLEEALQDMAAAIYNWADALQDLRDTNFAIPGIRSPISPSDPIPRPWLMHPNEAQYEIDTLEGQQLVKAQRELFLREYLKSANFAPLDKNESGYLYFGDTTPNPANQFSGYFVMDKDGKPVPANPYTPEALASIQEQYQQAATSMRRKQQEPAAAAASTDSGQPKGKSGRAAKLKARHLVASEDGQQQTDEGKQQEQLSEEQDTPTLEPRSMVIPNPYPYAKYVDKNHYPGKGLSRDPSFFWGDDYQLGDQWRNEPYIWNGGEAGMDPMHPQHMPIRAERDGFLTVIDHPTTETRFAAPGLPTSAPIAIKPYMGFGNYNGGNPDFGGDYVTGGNAGEYNPIIRPQQLEQLYAAYSAHERLIALAEIKESKENALWQESRPKSGPTPAWMNLFDLYETSPPRPVTAHWRDSAETPVAKHPSKVEEHPLVLQTVLALPVETVVNPYIPENKETMQYSIDIRMETEWEWKEAWKTTTGGLEFPWVTDSDSPAAKPTPTFEEETKTIPRYVASVPTPAITGEGSSSMEKKRKRKSTEKKDTDGDSGLVLNKREESFLEMGGAIPLESIPHPQQDEAASAKVEKRDVPEWVPRPMPDGGSRVVNTPDGIIKHAIAPARETMFVPPPIVAPVQALRIPDYAPDTKEYGQGTYRIILANGEYIHMVPQYLVGQAQIDVYQGMTPFFMDNSLDWGEMLPELNSLGEMPIMNNAEETFENYRLVDGTYTRYFDRSADQDYVPRSFAGAHGNYWQAYEPFKDGSENGRHPNMNNLYMVHDFTDARDTSWPNGVWIKRQKDKEKEDEEAEKVVIENMEMDVDYLRMAAAKRLRLPLAPTTIFVTKTVPADTQAETGSPKKKTGSSHVKRWIDPYQKTENMKKAEREKAMEEDPNYTPPQYVEHRQPHIWLKDSIVEGQYNPLTGQINPSRDGFENIYPLRPVSDQDKSPNEVEPSAAYFGGDDGRGSASKTGRADDPHNPHPGNDLILEENSGQLDESWNSKKAYNADDYYKQPLDLPYRYNDAYSEESYYVGNPFQDGPSYHIPVFADPTGHHTGIEGMYNDDSGGVPVYLGDKRPKGWDRQVYLGNGLVGHAQGLAGTFGKVNLRPNTLNPAAKLWWKSGIIAPPGRANIAILPTAKDKANFDAQNARKTEEERRNDDRVFLGEFIPEGYQHTVPLAADVYGYAYGTKNETDPWAPPRIRGDLWMDKSEAATIPSMDDGYQGLSLWEADAIAKGHPSKDHYIMRGGRPEGFERVKTPEEEKQETFMRGLKPYGLDLSSLFQHKDVQDYAARRAGLKLMRPEFLYPAQEAEVPGNNLLVGSPSQRAMKAAGIALLGRSL
ncbi:hypothetical protein BJ508DRAFT_7020 [Ascobolus immersus RN42]|uniref:Uncharacterized protein n=1 Tax=Ascobolus immersus RN42 TaxID=1160509 RepID=A0A3N4II71_ASCIM|nr:hypothetical protein BJ508DRAFT_7020 [Ascobolus immersus RN42]